MSPPPSQGGPAVSAPNAAVFVLSPRKTKSLDRAVEVIEYMQHHLSSPASVQEISDACHAYYEEVLHILTTLEALELVERYGRDGSPREGPRVAYMWRQPTHAENRRARDGYKAHQRDGDSSPTS